MNTYKIVLILSVFSLSAFSGKRESYTVSIRKALSVVFVYNGCDKKDKDCKEHLSKLIKAFGTFKKDSGYRKIGVAMIDLDLTKNEEFAKKYLDDGDHNEPMILFFNRGLLLEEETLYPEKEKDWQKKLTKKLSDPKEKIGKLVVELQEEYEIQRDKEEEMARASAMSILYPTVADLYYHGIYQPFYPHRTYWGFGGGYRPLILGGCRY